MELVTEWAGKDRLFRLTFGGVMDVEQATGRGIGETFINVASGRFNAIEVYSVIKHGLKGGGMDVLSVNHLMDTAFDTRPYMENAALAGEILAQLMVGVEGEPEGDTSEAPPPHKFSEISQICREFNMSPLELREMRYADFVNLLKGFNAASDRKAEHLTEEEFRDILERYEPEALNG